MYDATARIGSFPAAILQASIATIDGVKARDGTTDTAKLPPDEREAVTVAYATLRPVLADRDLVVDLQDIRDFWSAAQEVHDDRMVDIQDYGGDAADIGKTEQAALPHDSVRRQLLLGAWDVLDERMPSEQTLSMKTTAAMVSAAEARDSAAQATSKGSGTSRH